MIVKKHQSIWCFFNKAFQVFLYPVPINDIIAVSYLRQKASTEIMKKQLGWCRFDKSEKSCI